MLLVGTALAASPGLREMLAEALGGFAAIAQEQESDVYTWNGFEVKVLSAMADEVMIRAYAQVTDLEGRNRMDIHDQAWRTEGPAFELGGLKSSQEITGASGCGGVYRYDKATQTAIVSASSYGVLMDDLSNARFKMDAVEHIMDDPWNPPVSIPLNVEIMPSKTVLRDIDADGVSVEEVRLSALSITLKWEKIYDYIPENELGLSSITMGVEMKDGTSIGTESEYANGHGSYRDAETGRHTNIMTWCFADPVDPDEVAGVYVGENYFPVG